MDFINWFSKNKIKNVGFEDMKNAIKDEHYIINTLPTFEQDCLIYGTIVCNKEEHIINHLIETNDKDRIIVIYGKHSADDSPQKKYDQLVNCGFKRVYIYTGGLFEWLLLQDVYSFGEFPTTIVCKDILKYRVASSL